jgi:hypothetical protein
MFSARASKYGLIEIFDSLLADGVSTIVNVSFAIGFVFVIGYLFCWLKKKGEE